MKWIKRLLILLIILLIWVTAIVAYCAYDPDMTQRIADALYGKNASTIRTDYSDPELDKYMAELRENVTLPAEALDMGNTSLAPEHTDKTISDADTPAKKDEADDNDPEKHTEYIAPKPADIKVPDSVSGKSGYEPVKETASEIGDDEPKQENPGFTGDDLIFDPLYYPYYQMLDDKGKHLYRQIFANAENLNTTFTPVEEINAKQLKSVFSAVYNDHPSLFWLDTAYSCKCRRNGEVVEIGLQFNKTAKDLDNAKQTFTENAEEILSDARKLDNDYEKEKFVHNALIDKITYAKNAPMSQSAYSGLVNGKTVCAGYARAFQYLLQQLDIPCYYCTGYAGESHAWNIVKLGDDYYNTDVTWDDTEAGNYDYFNKTDADYASTHMRQELSVNLPPCNGTAYRNLENAEPAAPDIPESSVLHSIQDYYNNCRYQMVQKGRGSYQFSNIVEGSDLLQEIFAAYQAKNYRQGYMDQTLTDINAQICDMSLSVEDLGQNRYRITHDVNVR